MRRVRFDDRAIARFRSTLVEPSGTSWISRSRALGCAIVTFTLIAHAGEATGSFPRGTGPVVRGVRTVSLREVDTRESSVMNSAHGVMMASVFAMAPIAQSAELLVPEQFQSVAQAVAAAVQGDVVSVASGTYSIGSLVLPDVSFTIRGRATAGATVLTGVDIQVLGGASVRSIANLTVQGCSGYGAIRVNGATLNLDSVNLESNQVHAVFLDHGATLNSNNCRIANNPRGGFVYVNCTWNATDCAFESNGYTTAYGGAVGIHVGSGGTFTRCRFIGNASAQGGAIGLSFSGSRLFDECYFEGNESADGAVWWTEFGASGVLRNSILCGHSQADLHGTWVDGGGNQFFPKGCNPPCPSDLVADGTVNAADMAIVLNFWGTNGSQFPGVDIDGDGVVNGSDLAAVLNSWGPCPQ